MRHAGKALTALISISLLSSTAVAAPIATGAQAAQPSGWMALSMLTPTGATVLGASGVGAAQSDAPLPPPPPPRDYGGWNDTTWLLIGSTLIMAAFLALALSHGHHHNGSVSPD